MGAEDAQECQQAAGTQAAHVLLDDGDPSRRHAEYASDVSLRLAPRLSERTHVFGELLRGCDRESVSHAFNICVVFLIFNDCVDYWRRIRRLAGFNT
jgi:hypothetical protein